MNFADWKLLKERAEDLEDRMITENRFLDAGLIRAMIFTLASAQAELRAANGMPKDTEVGIEVRGKLGVHRHEYDDEDKCKLCGKYSRKKRGELAREKKNGAEAR